MLYELAHKGWIVVTVSYRFIPKVTYPENLEDCKRALRWVKQNIEKYNGNKDYIIVGGESAGSHLALLLALTMKENNEEDLSIRGCVDFYGVYNTKKLSSYSIVINKLVYHKYNWYVNVIPAVTSLYLY